MVTFSTLTVNFRPWSWASSGNPAHELPAQTSRNATTIFLSFMEC